MELYEFHGSIRIQAESEQAALTIIDSIERKMKCEIHVNDMEVV